MEPARAIAVLIALTMIASMPGVSAQQDAFPTYDDVSTALTDAAATSDWVRLHDAGESIEGRKLHYVAITDPDSEVPFEQRVVTMILTQQHGNEPAGTPAALALLEDLLGDAPQRGLLSNQIVLLWPMGNPDGATQFQRANQAGSDLNRDHVHLEQPETQALHRVMVEWDVHIGMDHHEYSGTGLGYPVPVRTYDFDVTTLYPRHGNVRAPTMQAALSLNYDSIWPALEEAGYTVGDYGVQTAAGVPVSHIAGGPDPGILRNNFGLNNIAGLLVESFVPIGANPFVDAERRAAVHRVVMDATLQHAHDNADAIIAAKRASERLNIEEPMGEYIEEWPDDPATGEPNSGNRRGPLGLAYAAAGAEEVMERHGLPAGFMAADGVVYDMRTERAGLLAAILHPDSSRNVVVGTEVAATASPGPVVETEGAQATPAVAPLVMLAGLVAAAMLLRRT